MSKSRSFSIKTKESEIERFAEYFNALSHPHRLKIFLRLASRCGPKGCSTEFETHACVSDVGKGLGIAPSTLSHHIKELKRVGLVHVERAGQSIGCSVEPNVLKDLESFFGKMGNCT